MKMNPNVLVLLLNNEPLLELGKGGLKVREELLLRELALRIGQETSPMVEAISLGRATTLELFPLEGSFSRLDFSRRVKHKYYGEI